MMTFKKLHSFSASLLSALALILVLTVVSCEKDDPTPEVQATCDDGIQNGDETGIDCGGSCSVCEEPVTMAAPDLNVAPIDMEETGYGPDFASSKENNASNPTGTWGVFGTDEANKMALSIVDNPNPTGNTSAHVLSIVEQAGQEPWQGFFFDLESKVAFSGTNTAISVDVHSVRAGQRVMLKLEDKTNASANTGEIIVATVGTGWETVVFNLSADYNGLFDRIVFIMDYGVVNDAVANHYMDNIRVSAPAETTGGGGDESAPTEGPTAPTAGAADVVSIFSDSYTDVTVDTWQTGWSNVGAYEEVDLGGNTVKKYSDLTFVGIETVSAQVDASGMTHFNLDMWSANATEFKIKLVDFGATGGFSGNDGDGQGDDVEDEYTISTPAQGEWVTVSLSLAEAFPGLTTTGNIAQLILSAAPGGEADVYIDNVYFSTDGSNGGGAAAGTYAPNYSGTFDGTVKDGDVYTFPADAAGYAGFANTNTEIYPLAFPNGGKITFTASSAGADAGIYFRFERLPYNASDSNATEPSFNTETITISGSTATEYTVTVAAQDAANTYSSALMYLTTRDVAVTITNIEITVD